MNKSYKISLFVVDMYNLCVSKSGYLEEEKFTS